MDNNAMFTLATGLAKSDPRTAIEAGMEATRRKGRSGGNAAEGIMPIPANFGIDQDKARIELETLGFQLLDEPSPSPSERERSFIRVRIPEGWHYEHSLDTGGIVIIDERGVKRVSLQDNGQFWNRYVATIIIDQGHEVPLRLIYGDGSLETVLWCKLTKKEKEDAMAGLRMYLIDRPEQTQAKAQMWINIIEALA